MVALCKDKHGSRVVDVLWRQSEVQRSKNWQSSLLRTKTSYMPSYYGKIVLRKCNISHYKKKQAAWQDIERATEKMSQW